ncbi:unnamed protein product, partial [marine sediment metagenome]
MNLVNTTINGGIEEMIKFIHSEDTESVLARCHDLLNEYHKTNDPLPGMLISTEKKLAGYY